MSVDKRSKIQFIISTMRQLSGAHYLRHLTPDELDKLSEEGVEALRLFVMDMQTDLGNARRAARGGRPH